MTAVFLIDEDFITCSVILNIYAQCVRIGIILTVGGTGKKMNLTYVEIVERASRRTVAALNLQGD